MLCYLHCPRIVQRWTGCALLLVTLLGFIPTPVLLPAATAQTAAEQVAPREFWLGMYMGARKIGYTQFNVAPTTFQGKPAIEMNSKSIVKITVLGSSVEQISSQRTISDLKYQPITQTFDITSNGSTLKMRADYDYAKGKIVCRIGEGANPATKTVLIPPGANLAGDTGYLTAGQKHTVGKKMTVYYLEPLTVQLQKSQIEVTGRATVKDLISGKDVAAFVVVSDTQQGKMTTYETEDGDPLRGSLNLGPVSILMAMETKERALDPNSTAPSMPDAENGKAGYTPPADFAVATAIKTDKPISNPRKVRALTVTISGIPEDKKLLSDLRQKVTVLPVANALAGTTARYQVRVPEVTDTVKLPITAEDLAAYQNAGALLEVDDPEIQQTAKELRGNETDACKVAVAIRDWVSKSMTADASIGVPRSAKDIYKRRRGVCRDYATLFAAIARAAGIPTRLCGGIVYADSRFFYHAWAESYVGQWVAFDPTLYDRKNPVEFVDATHIKFAQGDVTDMFDVASVIGKLRITVQEAAQ